MKVYMLIIQLWDVIANIHDFNISSSPFFPPSIPNAEKREPQKLSGWAERLNSSKFSGFSL